MIRAFLLVLAAAAALPAAAAAAAASPADPPPLWGPLSPGATTASDATQLLQALESGVGDITLAGAHAAARCAVQPPGRRTHNAVQ